MKKCGRCKVDKNRDSFYKSSYSKDGLEFECKQCTRERKLAKYPEHRAKILLKQKEAYQANPKEKRRRTRDNELARKFGINREKYNDMLAKCGNACEICGASGDEFMRGLHIDHNHCTGLVRGILCVRCNQGLGNFLCDTGYERLLLAIEYVKEKEDIYARS